MKNATHQWRSNGGCLQIGGVPYKDCLYGIVKRLSRTTHLADLGGGGGNVEPTLDTVEDHENGLAYAQRECPVPLAHDLQYSAKPAEVKSIDCFALYK